MDNVASFGKTMFDASAVADYAKRLAKHTGMELVRVNPMLLQIIRGERRKSFEVMKSMTWFILLYKKNLCL